MDKKDIQRLAEIISEELGGCFIPRPFVPPIDPLNKDGEMYVDKYRRFNKQHRDERKWMLAKSEEILARFTHTK